MLETLTNPHNHQRIRRPPSRVRDWRLELVSAQIGRIEAVAGDLPAPAHGQSLAPLDFGSIVRDSVAGRRYHAVAMKPSSLAAALLALALGSSACAGTRPQTLLDTIAPTSGPPSAPHDDTPVPVASEPSPPGSPAIATERGTVTRVVDGDTAHVRLASGAIEKVRFIGVDTPESTTRHEPYGAEASRFTKSRLDGATVFLEYDVERRDRYGRLLAYVWLNLPSTGSFADVRDNMFNATLVAQGYAQMATYPPNVRYVDVFRSLQQQAREANRGLWGLPANDAFPHAAPASSSAARTGSCDPSYPDVCIPPPPPDLDCGDIEHRRFRVLQPDPHGFDGDRDGIGCER